MDELRREELRELFYSETNEADTWAWRDHLTAEERSYVVALERDYDRGMRQLCGVILIRDKLRRRFRPEQIREIITLREHCRLVLSDGRAFDAFLTSGGELKLLPIDEAC